MASDTTMIEVATRYWLHNETMQAIARDMGVSRSTISRMLSEARDLGVVQVKVRQPAVSSPMDRELSDRFGVNARVVHLPANASANQRLRRVTQVAGDLLVNILTPDDVVGIAWGTTIVNVSEQLNAHPIPGLTLVQINGAVNTRNSGIPWVGDLLTNMATKMDARIVYFPVPAFFDNPKTKELMWQERSVKAVLEVQSKMTVALFSVGVLSGPTISHVYANGYLDEKDMLALRQQGVVGDVCTVMLREDGTYEDIPINQGATGYTPAQLAEVPRRICVVSGPTKAAPLLGALRAGVATDLVIDWDTAKALLSRANR
ncbi:sugar-binding transcriptional regulator [Stomatohabitans albus]|uniref:sugar-binding transcriptional regulator n=1 Tax=Stomatohabitans albus TaxID=3110766 RepID=UPI00300C56BE